MKFYEIFKHYVVIKNDRALLLLKRLEDIISNSFDELTSYHEICMNYHTYISIVNSLYIYHDISCDDYLFLLDYWRSCHLLAEFIEEHHYSIPSDILNYSEGSYYLDDNTYYSIANTFLCNHVHEIISKDSNIFDYLNAHCVPDDTDILPF